MSSPSGLCCVLILNFLLLHFTLQVLTIVEFAAARVEVSSRERVMLERRPTALWVDFHLKRAQFQQLAESRCERAPCPLRRVGRIK